MGDSSHKLETWSKLHSLQAVQQLGEHWLVSASSRQFSSSESFS